MSWKKAIMDAIELKTEEKLTPKDEIETLEKLSNTPEEMADGLIQACDNDITKACDKLATHLDNADDGYRKEHPMLGAAKIVLDKIVDEAVSNSLYVESLKQALTEANPNKDLVNYTPIDPSVVLRRQDAAKVDQMKAYAMAGIHPNFIDVRPLLRYIDDDGNRHVVVLDNIDRLDVEDQKVYLLPVHIGRNKVEVGDYEGSASENDTDYDVIENGKKYILVPYLSYGDKFAMDLDLFLNHVLYNDLNSEVVAEVTRGESTDPEDWLDEIDTRMGQLHSYFQQWRADNMDKLDLAKYDDMDVIKLYQYITKDGYSPREAEYKLWSANEGKDYSEDQKELVRSYIFKHHYADIDKALAALNLKKPSTLPKVDPKDPNFAIKKYINSMNEPEDTQTSSDLNIDTGEDDWEDTDSVITDLDDIEDDVEESVNLTEKDHDKVMKDSRKVYNALKALGINRRFCVEQLKMPDIFAEDPADDEEGEKFKIVTLPDTEDEDPETFKKINKVYIKNAEKGARMRTMSVDDVKTLLRNKSYGFKDDEDFLWDRASSMFKQRQPLHMIPFGTWRELSNDEVRQALNQLQQTDAYKYIDLLGKFEDDLKTGKRNPIIIRALRSLSKDDAIKFIKKGGVYKYYIWDVDPDNKNERRPNAGHQKPFRDLRHATGG